MMAQKVPAKLTLRQTQTELVLLIEKGLLPESFLPHVAHGRDGNAATYHSETNLEIVLDVDVVQDLLKDHDDRSSEDLHQLVKSDTVVLQAQVVENHEAAERNGYRQHIHRVQLFHLVHAQGQAHPPSDGGRHKVEGSHETRKVVTVGVEDVFVSEDDANGRHEIK